MFGYVVPCKPELKVCEWQAYRAAYCGLCKELKREYGFASRLFLNYDLVLLALVADGLAGSAGTCTPERCIANPLEKRPVCAHTDGLSLAADALVLTVYYKLLDDVADERFFKRLPALLLRPVVGRCRKKAAARHAKTDELLAQQTAAQQALEAARISSPDAAAEPTAQMTAALFSEAGDAHCQKILARFGLFLGKIIYYLDAAEDYEKDKKNGAYNMFLLQGLTKDEAVAETKRLCRLCAGEMSLCYNLLRFTANKPLLDNILFLGVPQSIARAGQPAQQTKHSQNNL
ncbi:MAG: DUF5685 family protein [Ruthenibacterium sp.]